MMVNTILGLRLPGLEDDDAAAEILAETFRENTALVRDLFGTGAEPSA